MAPKPFPFPIGVGVDICYLPRLGMILNKQDDYVTRWARKIFTRQEWPGLWQKFHETGALHITSSVPEPQLVLPNLNLLPYIKPDLRHQGVKKERSRDLIQDPQPPPLSIIISHQRWLLLAQYLGGRFVCSDHGSDFQSRSQLTSIVDGLPRKPLSRPAANAVYT